MKVDRVLYGGGSRPFIKTCSCHRNSISMATEGKGALPGQAPVTRITYEVIFPVGKQSS